MSDIYRIESANLVALQEKIKKMNQRAVRLGCDQVVLTILGSELVKATKVMPGGRTLKYKYEVNLVTMSGNVPRLAGWSLIAKIEYLEDERLILCVPGESCPEEFRTRGIECDHCKSTRNRKNVFVLRKGSEYVQVGRDCIRDFLGGVSPEQLMSQATWSFSVTEMCEKYVSVVPETINIIEYLNAVSICVRRLGWLSKSAIRFNDSSTSTDAWALCKPPENKTDWEKWVEKNSLIHQSRDESLVVKVLEWSRGQGKTSNNDYLYNLGVACRVDYVTLNTAGIVASAISAYMRHMDRELERKREHIKKSREWVGQVEVRQDFTGLTVLKINSFNGNYGVTTLVSFEDTPGNLVKWFASKNVDDIEVGDIIDIKATVKKHDEYEGVKQTIITRAKILKINKVAA